MAILLNNDGHEHDSWVRALQVHMPEQTIFAYPDIPDPNDIEYALVWKHPYGDLNRYTNLKAVFSLGSGTDHLDKDPDPISAPTFRLIDTAMAHDMALYTLYWVIHFQRKLETYREQQSQGLWQRFPTPIASNFNITLLGMGVIGTYIAQTLASNDFNVSGWSRSSKHVETVKCVNGSPALPPLLGQTDVLVCCLPHTPSTDQFLDKTVLSSLKPGACFINISRGAVVNESDLISLLDSGHINYAVLDVFHQEPLDTQSPFWSHPKVHVTPHMSGATNTDTAAKIITENIKKLQRGDIPDHLYIRTGADT